MSKLASLKEQSVISQGSIDGLGNSSVFAWVLHAVAIRCQPGLCEHPPELEGSSLTWLAGDATCWLEPNCGCWLEHLNMAFMWLMLFRTQQLILERSVSRGSIPRDKASRILDILGCHYPHILLVKKVIKISPDSWKETWNFSIDWGNGRDMLR